MVELQQHTETEAIEKLLWAHSEHVLHAGLLKRSIFERSLNASNIIGDIGVVERQVFEGTEIRASFFDSAHADQPARGFRHEEDGGCKGQGDESWESERKTP